VRIIAGSRKGHTIHAPKGLDTRPTGDRVREAAFNLIGPVDGATVLDLFAGAGGMGLEALSRGAVRAVFVESDRQAVRAIERNLDKLRLKDATVLEQDAIRALAAEAATGRTYDLVLVDPPYAMFADLQSQLARYLPSVLAPDGLLVVETEAKLEPDLPLAQRTSRRYGSARLTLFEHASSASSGAAGRAWLEQCDQHGPGEHRAVSGARRRRSRASPGGSRRRRGR
jgi:16S rRNA (guanine(966)-N(2))-methyltransferase RsmD